MKSGNTVLNVFGIIAAAILSVILVVVLIAAPVISSVSSFTDPQTIREMITKLDYAELLGGLSQADSTTDQSERTGSIGNQALGGAPMLYAAGNIMPAFPMAAAQKSDSLEAGLQDQIQKTLGESGIPLDALDEIMETEAVSKILDLVTEEIIASLSGEEGSGQITPVLLKQIINDNIDEIIEVGYQYIEDQDAVSHETLKATILSEADAKAADFVEAVSTVKNAIAEKMDVEVLTVVRYSASGIFDMILWVMIVLLSALIALCRFPRFKGFLWLGIVYALGALASLVMFVAFDGILLTVLESAADGQFSFLLPAVDVIVGTFGKWAILSFVIALVMIAVFVVGRLWLGKKGTPNSMADGTPQPIESMPVAP